MEVNYHIDRVNIRSYGVYISASEGILGRPKAKAPVTANWPTYHGEVVDLDNKYYDSREIKLNCFIKAQTKAEFIVLCNQFLSLFDQKGLRHMTVSVDGSEPLVFMVYLSNEVNIDKAWSDNTMVGKFVLQLKEPEPVKKILKWTRTGESDKTVSITTTSTKMLNVYWGDGAHTYDISGIDQTVVHSYDSNGTFYIVITGNIDDITSLTTTGTLVWSKL